MSPAFENAGLVFLLQGCGFTGFLHCVGREDGQSLSFLQQKEKTNKIFKRPLQEGFSLNLSALRLPRS
jgi:hypothetical protein